MVEDAPGLRQMVQTSVNHPFHGLHDAGGEADGTVRLDRARWFPCLQQRNDGRIPPSLRHFRLVERLVEDPQQLPLARGPKAFRKLGGDVVGASRSVLPHLLDGSVQLLNAEFCCGAVVHAGGVASDLGKSVFLPLLSRELQLAHLGIMSSEGIGFAFVRDKDLAVVPDRLVRAARVRLAADGAKDAPGLLVVLGRI